MPLIYSLLFLVLLPLSGGEFSDEFQQFDKECLGEDLFTCVSGGCVDSEKLCDGVQDCDDGTDENFCLNSRPDTLLCNVTEQYLCGDGSRCIPHDWVCNNEKDCLDGSDEANCTDVNTNRNGTCSKGFLCGDGKCISKLWTCDGKHDCTDGSDEVQNSCRHALLSHQIHDGLLCHEEILSHTANYRCVDASYCLPADMMCDSIPDCRDGSDEGPFCTNWSSMCKSDSCFGKNVVCAPGRSGPKCLCTVSTKIQQYNYTSQRCEDIDRCITDHPICSHSCESKDGVASCYCDEGYKKNGTDNQCFAPSPEAMLFFTTLDEVKYIKIKSGKMITVANGLKKAHGVSFDGQYVYWVETALGHQSIVRAHLEDVKGTKEVLISLGIEDPGDIAVDWFGGNIYFSDSERGVIVVCRRDGTQCRTLKTKAKNPKFVTLDFKNGKMYWADVQYASVIMKANMDGTTSTIFVDNLTNFATGLALDEPNGRLYFVDKTIKAVRTDNGKVYSLLQEPFHHPYSIAVFENTIYWSDWAVNTIQTIDKLNPTKNKKDLLVKLNTQVFGLHIYHPILTKSQLNPCGKHNCTHLCLIKSNITYTCACPDGMELSKNGTCQNKPNYHPEYLIIGAGSTFTRLQYDRVGNPLEHATMFDIATVKALTVDNNDHLHVYDSIRKSINIISMSGFNVGVTSLLVYNRLNDIVDMDYDYATDSLYWLDADMHTVEVFSLKTKQRAIIFKFDTEEVPVGFCVVPEYGKMLVAVIESDRNNEVHIDSIGLDGSERHHILMNDLRGPRILLRYSRAMDQVYVADAGSGIIDYMHPEGNGRENFITLHSTITSLALTDTYIFWTGRHDSKLYWSDIHETMPKRRSVELSIFPLNVPLLITATKPISTRNSLSHHPCLTGVCSHICVQLPHFPLHRSNITPVNSSMPFKCLCPPEMELINGNCREIARCKENELYCHESNECFPVSGRCDGKTDCTHGEDEEGCNATTTHCSAHETICNGECIDKFQECKPNDTDVSCPETQFKCANESLCIERIRLCDDIGDCMDGSDELNCPTFTCLETEFMCKSGSCILRSWRCDGELDCNDGSDEEECETKPCPLGSFQCHNGDCIELKNRCDAKQDCADLSDEQGCYVPEIEQDIKPECAMWEYTCENDKSICLPLLSRCNGHIDCPDGTDEQGCDMCGPHGMFECQQKSNCIYMNKVCDGVKHCLDGSDETPEACKKECMNSTSCGDCPAQMFECQKIPCILMSNVCDGTNHCADGSDEKLEACEKVHKKSRHYVYPAAECNNGYLCGTGQCIEWHEVCDQVINCFDGSDESEHCFTPCERNTCNQNQTCIPTPTGPRCICGSGFEAIGHGCRDVDECEADVCAQGCRNLPGSYRCECRPGYALKPDLRSCKAIHGNMSVLYVTGNSVGAISNDGHNSIVYHDSRIASITDIDYDVRRHKLYITSAEAGVLIQSNNTHNDILITNIGRPTKVAVDWVTGNVFFVDSTPSAGYIRVCNVEMQRCARIQALPSNSKVTAFTLDPASRILFYCVITDSGGDVISGLFSKRHVTSARNCSGLAADSYLKRLYISEFAPPTLRYVSYNGSTTKTIISNNPNLELPYKLVLFEDYIYFLVANSFKFSRCLLYGTKKCEPYYWRLFDSNTFVISHESIQRGDLTNSCDGFVCSNVCVLSEDGPVCVCDNGDKAQDGVCPDVDKNMLPRFNGRLREDKSQAHHISLPLVISVVVLFAAYLSVFLYYHFVYKRRAASPYVEVRFQNTEIPQDVNATPTVNILGIGAQRHEFVNPLQFIQDVWRQSSKRTRPVVTPKEPHIDVENIQDLSDTESDLDDRDTRHIMRK